MGVASSHMAISLFALHVLSIIYTNLSIRSTEIFVGLYNMYDSIVHEISQTHSFGFVVCALNIRASYMHAILWYNSVVLASTCYPLKLMLYTTCDRPVTLSEVYPPCTSVVDKNPCKNPIDFSVT